MQQAMCPISLDLVAQLYNSAHGELIPARSAAQDTFGRARLPWGLLDGRIGIAAIAVRLRQRAATNASKYRFNLLSARHRLRRRRLDDRDRSAGRRVQAEQRRPALGDLHQEHTSGNVAIPGEIDAVLVKLVKKFAKSGMPVPEASWLAVA
jgi:hypothetical protein